MQEQQTHEQKQQKAAIKLETELREKREEKHREAAGTTPSLLIWPHIHSSYSLE